MIEFYLAAVLMTALVVAITWRAMVRAAHSQLRLQNANLQRDRDNLALFDERQRELDSALKNAQIDSDTHALLIREATSQLLADTDSGESQIFNASAQSRASRTVLFLCAMVLPLVAMTLYQPWGVSLGANDQWGVRQYLINFNQSADRTDENSVNTSFATLVQQLESYASNRFADEELLLLLLQAYRSSNDLPQSEDLLRRILENNRESAEVQTELAEVIYLNRLAGQGGQHAGLTVEAYDEIDGLLNQALTTSPQYSKALSLAGMSAFQQQDYDAALGYWRRALQELSPASSQAETIRRGIQAALGFASEAVAGKHVKAWVDVRIVAELPGDKTVDPNTPVFVFARAEQGPPMPLAARRLVLGDLPVTIRLSDLDQMAAIGLDAADRVKVQARLALDGQPVASAGDFESQSQIVPVARHDRGQVDETVELTINRQVE